MKKILIVASNYMDLKISSNNRTNYLPQFLHDNGYDVEVVTTDFNHHRKEHVKETEPRKYKLTLLHELGYKKNVSIKRVFSIRSYKKRLKKYLKSRGFVDTVYVFVPPHSIAQVAYKYAKRVNAKFVIDVRDLWPEAYQMLIKNKYIYKLIFFPMILNANKTYRLADHIIAVSRSYLHRAQMHNSQVKGHVIYLGTSFSLFDKYAKQGISTKKKNEIWITYAGTIGNSYDVELLLRAYKLILTSHKYKVKLHILGSGPLIEKMKRLDKDLETNAVFYGRVAYKDMVQVVAKSDIVVNVLVENAPQSIINKHMDYAASGLPVISNQKNEEYINLITRYQAGISIKENSAEALSEAMNLLINDNQLRKEMGDNHRKMGEELFNRDKIYDVLLTIL